MALLQDPTQSVICNNVSGEMDSNLPTSLIDGIIANHSDLHVLACSTTFPVERYGLSPATEFALISRTLHHTITHNAGFGRSVSGETFTAITPYINQMSLSALHHASDVDHLLLSVLQSSIIETFLNAKVNTLLHRHIFARRRCVW